MNGSSRPPSRVPTTHVFSRSQQWAAATVTVIATAVLLVSWIAETVRRGRPVDIDRSPPAVATAPPIIDVNSADWPELTLLPGISETMARRIVEFREANGAFQRTDDLRNVRGIGPRSLARISPFLKPVSPVSPIDAP